jgi:DNA-binding IclR family transcriptional regulator
MSVGAIATEVDAPSSTVCRILETLKARGYVEQGRNRGDYSAGLRVLGLSAEILNRMKLRRKAGPYLRALTEKSGCSVFLAAASNGKAVIVMTDHPGGLIQASVGEIGTVNSCQYTASGKLIAAFLPDEEQERLLNETVMERRTIRTIMSKSALRSEWIKTEKSGIGRTEYENSIDLYGIAVPVRNFEGTLIGALGLVVKRKNVTEIGIDHFERLLFEHGEQLSFALGYAAETLV